MPSRSLLCTARAAARTATRTATRTAMRATAMIAPTRGWRRGSSRPLGPASFVVRPGAEQGPARPR
eukprot:4157409-Prymnesium_polylepis.1